MGYHNDTVEGRRYRAFHAFPANIRPSRMQQQNFTALPPCNLEEEVMPGIAQTPLVRSGTTRRAACIVTGAVFRA